MSGKVDSGIKRREVTLFGKVSQYRGQMLKGAREFE